MGSMILKRSSISRSRIKPVSEEICGALEIDHDGPVKIRPDYLFLAFTTIEHLGDPLIAKYISLYHIVMLFPINSCGIIQDHDGYQIIPSKLSAGAHLLPNRPPVPKWPLRLHSPPSPRS